MYLRRVFRALRRFSLHGVFPTIIEGHLVVATLDLLWRESPEWLRTLIEVTVAAVAAVLVWLGGHPAVVLGGSALAAIYWVGTTLARHGRIFLIELRRFREDLRGIAPRKRSGTPRAIVTRVRGTERKVLTAALAKKNKKTKRQATMPNETWTGPAVSVVSTTSATAYQAPASSAESKMKVPEATRKPPKRAAEKEHIKTRPLGSKVGA